MKPLVAIIGRPNVGKSTLFNRIVGGRKALTMGTPGVTRDRHYASADWSGHEFICIDTGGFPVGNDSLSEKVQEQIEFAIAESDVILCIFDGRAGLVPEERELASRLRQFEKPIYYVVNKIDTLGQQGQLADFYSLGVDPLFPVSGEHGTGVAELLDAMTAKWEREEESVEENSPFVNVAVVGRPNVGKSSLINVLLGSPRHVVDSTPGTTRDVIDSQFHVGEDHFRLLDTAGIRRQAQKGGKLEQVTILRSLRAIERADVCLLVLAADEGVLKQDAHIAGYIEETGRNLLILWNKMDRVDWGEQSDYEERTRQAFRFVPYAPILFVSAQEGTQVESIPSATLQLYQESGFRVPTAKLNAAFEHIVEEHPLPLHRGREIRLYYAAQIATHPPTFVIFANHPEGIPRSYGRYIKRRLRESFDLKNVPLRITFRRRKR